jgi:hypothetical protein
VKGKRAGALPVRPLPAPFMTVPRSIPRPRPVAVAVEIPDTPALHRPWPELVAAAVAYVSASAAVHSVFAGR